MKKILLLLFIGISFYSRGQTSVYHPFPESNATWNIFYDGGFFSICNEEFSYSLSGDTVIANLTYHKIVIPYVIKNDACSQLHPTGYFGCIREDTSARQVFYIHPDSSAEELLYDFTRQVGDSVPGFIRFNCFASTLEVLEIDSILIGTNYRKRWIIGHHLTQIPYNSIIEGIGYETGLLQQCPEGPSDLFFYDLKCFQQNGITLYPDSLTGCMLIDKKENLELESQIEVFPNPFNDFLNIKSNSNKPFEIILYDFSMRKLLQQTFSQTLNLNTEGFSKGVYIYEIRNPEGAFSRGKVVKD